MGATTAPQDPTTSPAGPPRRATRRRYSPLLFDPDRRTAAWVAAAVLVVSSSVSWLLYREVDDQVPYAPPPGVVFVTTSDDRAGPLGVEVQVAYGAGLAVEGMRTVFPISASTSRPLAAPLRLVFCGRVADGLSTTGAVFPGEEVSSAVVAAVDFELGEPITGSRDCVAVDLGPVGQDPVDGGTDYRVGIGTDATWGETSGVTTYFQYPSVMLAHAGTLTGSATVQGLPPDLRGFESSPGASTPPATWDFEEIPPTTTTLQLSADSREAQATEQRLNILLGIALGLAGSAAIWLLDVAVSALSRARDTSPEPDA